MADLDDFFAKKDKKKSRKPKFLTAEELVKNLEETKRDVLKLKKPETTETPETENSVAEDKTVEQVSNYGDDGVDNDKDREPILTDEEGDRKKQHKDTLAPPEDEWKEVEEEQRKDYSGLKIGQMTLNDEDDDDNSDGLDDDGADSDGNINPESGRREGGGPWKKVVPADEVTQIPMEMPKPVAVVKAYVSPALRAAQASSMGSGIKPKVRPKTAPDITNADFFPTLGAARPEEQRKKKNEPAFEEVRHGSRVQRVKEPTVAPSAATNRFQTLDETDS